MRTEPEGIEKLRKLKAPKIKRYKKKNSKVPGQSADNILYCNIMDLLDTKPVSEVTYSDLKEVYRPVVREYGEEAVKLDKMKNLLRRQAITQAMDEVNSQLKIMFFWIDEITSYRKMKG